ncbi:MAG: hypothetical protein K1Y36_27510 [Blastocatellia bacterium]|nr:hypothetical protein [Blastocatellia bacterium]
MLDNQTRIERGKPGLATGNSARRPQRADNPHPATGSILGKEMIAKWVFEETFEIDENNLNYCEMATVAEKPKQRPHLTADLKPGLRTFPRTED